MVSIFIGGEGEIRTRGESPHAGFQDRYHQPLGHLSMSVIRSMVTVGNFNRLSDASREADD